MDHDRPSHPFRIIMSLRTTVLQVEFLWKLEVELNGGTLEGPAKRIFDGDVNFWSIEGAITWGNIPFSRLETF